MNEFFSVYYKKIGGQLSSSEINSTIRIIYDYLSDLYPKEENRENFPTSIQEVANIINTFNCSKDIDNVRNEIIDYEDNWESPCGT